MTIMSLVLAGFSSLLFGANIGLHFQKWRRLCKDESRAGKLLSFFILKGVKLYMFLLSLNLVLVVDVGGGALVFVIIIVNPMVVIIIIVIIVVNVLLLDTLSSILLLLLLLLLCLQQLLFLSFLFQSLLLLIL